MRPVPPDDRIVDVGLRPFDPGPDAQRLQGWLRQPHVAPWWGDPRLALEDALRRSSDTCAIILADGVPVGYLCWQTLPPEDLAAAGLADLPDGLVDIDIVVGEPTAVGRGIGPRALALLLGRLRADPSVTVAGVGTSAANRRAIRAFTKAGFGLFREFQDPEFGPCWYMTVDVGRSA